MTPESFPGTDAGKTKGEYLVYSCATKTDVNPMLRKVTSGSSTSYLITNLPNRRR
jgi:hypothetical protein